MDIIIEQIDKLNEYLHLSSDLNKKDFNYFNTMLQSMRNEAINYTRCCTELCDCEIPKPKDPYNEIDKNYCRDCENLIA
jgi:hypothetical protein